jgi:hypothetical protein
MTYSKNKTQKSTVREEPPLFDLISPKKKYKYICNCMVCKGKEVDARTQTKYVMMKLYGNLIKKERSN